MSIYDNNKALSLEAAIYRWNQEHFKKEEQLYPGSPKLEELGKSLLIHYSAEKGYWLAPAGSDRIFRALYLGSGSSKLGAKQLEEVQKIKKTFALAAQSDNDKPPKDAHTIKTARVRAAFGDACADAYDVLMKEPQIKKEIEEARDSFLAIFEQLEKNHHRVYETAKLFKIDDIYRFKKELHDYSGLPEDHRLELEVLEEVHADQAPPNKAPPPRDFLSAISKWNMYSQTQNQILPGFPLWKELGKNILIEYSAEKGFSLREIGRAEKFISSWIGDRSSPLGKEQQEEIEKGKQFLVKATESALDKPAKEQLLIYQARIEAVAGEKLGRVFAALMMEDLITRKKTLQSCFGETDEEIAKGLEEMLKSFPEIEINKLNRDIAARDVEKSPEKTDKIDEQFELEKRYLEIFRSKIASAAEEHFKKVQTAIREEFPDDQRITAVKTHLLFKDFFHKALDSVTGLGPRITLFEGYRREIAIESILRDLEAFQKDQEGQLTAAEKERLELAIVELRFAQKVFPRSLDFEENMKIYALKAGDIRIQLREMNENVKPHALLFPAGSSNHAVLCKIEKMESGRFKLTVVNTGLGSGEKGHDLNVARTRGVVRTFTRDTVYENLTLEDLSKEFLIKLIRFGDTGTEMTGPGGFYDLLDKALLKPESPARKVEGTAKRYHQEQGTCTFKSVLENTRDVLGDELFLKFEIDMIGRSSKPVVDLFKSTQKKTSEVISHYLFPGAPFVERARLLYTLVYQAERLQEERKQELAAMHKVSALPVEPAERQEPQSHIA